MGVHDLWSILEPIRKSVPLYSLSGKTLAVDLSLWVCEAQHVQAMMGRVTKPHLRNLFFRVSALTLMGVKLVFVMEGEAPKIKAETMSKRNQGRFGTSKSASAASKSTTNTNRGRFKAVLRECAEMLDYMGVPWVTAAGEAEAMCAYLDSQGLVDGCITNDGDAFLYGARTIYRNFNMNTKDPQVDCYKTRDVQRELKLSRENLVGLAIFLGCDYIPKGIQGIGKEQALKFIHTLEGQSILQKFNLWKEDNTFCQESTAKKVPHCNVCRHPGSAKSHEKIGCLLCESERFCEPQDFDYLCPCAWHQKEQCRQASVMETNIKKKTLANPLFPFTEIINEFLLSKDKAMSHFNWRQPNMLLIQKFAHDKMEWPKHYTSEKILVLMTYTNLINKKYGKDVSGKIKPIRILKPRVRNGVSCFEVIWTTPEHYSFPEDPAPENQDEVRTVEEESLFRLAYPEVVQSFQMEKAIAEEKKSKKKRPKNKKEKTVDEPDGISDLLAQMTLQSSSSKEKLSPQLPLSVCTLAEPEVGVSSVIVSLERQAKSGSLGLDDCSNSLQSPTELRETDSLSVSAVVSALHLSDIDWESASFMSSPLHPVKSCNNVQTNLTLTLHSERKDNDETEILKETDPLTLNEQPLRERILIKNGGCHINRNDISKPRSMEMIYSQPSCSQNVSSDHSKSELSEKSRQADERMKNTVKTSIVNEAQSDPIVSKQAMKAIALGSVAIRTNNRWNAPPKHRRGIPPKKSQFVKPALASSSQRSASDPGQSDKVKTIKQKSVCMNGGLSIDDSDDENHATPLRKYKTKTRDFPLKPAPDAVEQKVGKKGKNSESTNHFKTIIPLESKRENAVPAITDDVFILSPASPVINLESDDSLNYSDSPLPLAERLKLKFLK